jgi:5-methylcytosine-specific restriction endonuclease McrA
MLHTQEAGCSSHPAPTTSQQLTGEVPRVTACFSPSAVSKRDQNVTDLFVWTAEGEVVPLREVYIRRLEKASLATRLRRDWLFLNGPCRHCGSWDDLEVDHIDPTEKEIESNTLWRGAAARRAAELAKCQVLCKICHRMKHASPHGSLGRYKRLGCRCDLCRGASAAARKKRSRGRQ